jgi:hypothetical protein
VAEVLVACEGDVTEKGLRGVGLGGDKARWLTQELESRGLIRRVGSRRQRVLALPLAETVARVRGVALPPRVERSDRGKPHRVPTQDEVRLLSDPGGLFAPGAVFPSDQVLPRRWAPDEPGQWAEGTRFVRYRNGACLGEYVYDGERVRERRENE